MLVLKCLVDASDGLPSLRLLSRLCQLVLLPPFNAPAGWLLEAARHTGLSSAPQHPFAALPPSLSTLSCSCEMVLLGQQGGGGGGCGSGSGSSGSGGGRGGRAEVSFPASLERLALVGCSHCPTPEELASKVG